MNDEHAKINSDNQAQTELVCRPQGEARLKGLDPVLLPVVTGTCSVLRSRERETRPHSETQLASESDLWLRLLTANYGPSTKASVA